MKELVDNETRLNDDVWFSYDTLSRKVTVHLKNNAELFFGDVGYVLGFSPKEDISQTSTAEREADLDHGFHHLYIYYDIIQPQYVGDALVPLLRIVPVEGKDGKRVNKSFLRPQYVPVSRKQFESIEVNIKRDTGETVPFEFRRVLLTLHIWKSRPVNFWKDEENSHTKSQDVRTVLLGNLPAFLGARFQRGYGLGSIFRGLFCWAVPHLQQGAKMLGKKALQTGVIVVQDVLAGENLKTATKKRVKQALGLPSQNSPQSGADKKKAQKGKRNQEKTIRLQARNGKHLRSRRNP